MYLWNVYITSDNRLSPEFFFEYLLWMVLEDLWENFYLLGLVTSQMKVGCLRNPRLEPRGSQPSLFLDISYMHLWYFLIWLWMDSAFLWLLPQLSKLYTNLNELRHNMGSKTRYGPSVGRNYKIKAFPMFCSLLRITIEHNETRTQTPIVISFILLFIFRSLRYLSCKKTVQK